VNAIANLFTALLDMAAPVESSVEVMAEFSADALDDRGVLLLADLDTLVVVGVTMREPVRVALALVTPKPLEGLDVRDVPPTVVDALDSSVVEVPSVAEGGLESSEAEGGLESSEAEVSGPSESSVVEGTEPLVVEDSESSVFVASVAAVEAPGGRVLAD